MSVYYYTSDVICITGRCAAPRWRHGHLLKLVWRHTAAVVKTSAAARSLLTRYGQYALHLDTAPDNLW